MIYNVSYFIWGGLELRSGVLSPAKPPWRRDWVGSQIQGSISLSMTTFGNENDHSKQRFSPLLRFWFCALMTINEFSDTKWVHLTIF